MLKPLIGIVFCISAAYAASSHDVFTFKCSTAMVCVDKTTCDFNGVYLKTTVSLTPEEEEFRSPLVVCKKPDGNRGVCCRDPEYKDDWPTDYQDAGVKKRECTPPAEWLPGGYCGVKETPPPPTPPPRPTTQRTTTLPPRPSPPNNRPTDDCKPPAVKLPNGECSVSTTKPPSGQETTRPPLNFEEFTTTTPRNDKPTPPPYLNSNKPDESRGCPPRNRSAIPDKVFKPFDSSDYEAGAGEFPWQGAVFTKSGQFLCVCYNTIYSTCTTTATCIKDYDASELQIAVGIYDIADPLSVYEFKKGDKNPQISGCSAIAFDPNYDSATGKYDIAILHLSKKVSYNHYTKAICLDEFYAIPFFSYDDCVVTGWGNSNTVHYIDVELLSESECKSAVPGFDSKAMSCAKPNHDVCKLAEFGGGFHCRETGKRNKKSADIYLLKGTYSGVDCGKKVITFSRIEFEWFKDALINPSKYPNRDSASSNKIRR